jgi:peptide-methionine (S)-S-oxide reductase
MRYDSSSSSSIQTKRPRAGVIVTLQLELTPEHGFVPEPLFDTKGRISFCLHWGNYLPGLHELVQRVLDTTTASSNSDDNDPNHDDPHQWRRVDNISLDAGWGSRRDDLIVIVTVPVDQLPQGGTYQPGQTLSVAGVSVVVVSTTTTNATTNATSTTTNQTRVVLDANPPLAGSSYSCSFTLESMDPMPPMGSFVDQNNNNNNDDDDTLSSVASSFQVATFAMGCFWAAELAMMRVEGVVGTKVGYSQGNTTDPDYEQVCTGETGHVECVMVVYDARVVSYAQLVGVAVARLQQREEEEDGGVTTTSRRSRRARGDATATSSSDDDDDSYRSVVDVGALFRQKHNENDDDDENRQYRHGIYYHSHCQRREAQAVLLRTKKNRPHKTSSLAFERIDILPAATFYDAEPFHQQYLYKGGQSARKGCKETIRCYG